MEEENPNFKKVFLIVMIISLSISALIGIIIFLFGSFGETEEKILFTTFAVAAFSLTALCSAALYDKHRYIIYPTIGVTISVISFLFISSLIWKILDPGDISMRKLALISIVISFSIAQSSLLLFIKSRKIIVNISLILTLIFISIVALMLIISILLELDMDHELYYRILGVFAILDVLGTIITPIILKVTSLNEPQTPKLTSS